LVGVAALLRVHGRLLWRVFTARFAQQGPTAIVWRTSVATGQLHQSTDIAACRLFCYVRFGGTCLSLYSTLKKDTAMRNVGKSKTVTKEPEISLLRGRKSTSLGFRATPTSTS
jgi:hypothetical protein